MIINCVSYIIGSIEVLGTIVTGINSITVITIIMTRKARQGGSGSGAEAQGPKGLYSWCAGIHSVTPMPPLVTPKRLQWFPGHIKTNDIQKIKKGCFLFCGMRSLSSKPLADIFLGFKDQYVPIH